MKNWTIRKRIIFGFSLLILLTATLGGFAMRSIMALNKDAAEVTQFTLPGIYFAGQIQAMNQANLALVYRWASAPTAEERTRIEADMKANSAAQGGLYKDYEGTIHPGEDRAPFELVQSTRKAYLNARNEFMKLRREQPEMDAQAYLRDTLDPVFVTYRKSLIDLVDRDKADSDAADQRITQTARQAKLLIWIALGTSLLVGLSVATAIIVSSSRALRGVANILDRSVSSVAAAANQVSGASHTLAEGSSEQAASLEETSASLEELTSMTQRNAESAQSAKNAAAKAKSSAEQGATEMEELSIAMNELKEASTSVAKIVKSIDEIAFQTNILALNAAVEAARAGEVGAGFAVVADEVRQLARRSAEASRESAATIETAMAKSERGLAISTRLGVELQDILKQSRDLDTMVGEIAVASQEQRQGISQINTAMSQVDRVTQSTAATAQESAAAAEELNGQAVALTGAVEALLCLVEKRAKSNAKTGKPSAHPGEAQAEWAAENQGAEVEEPAARG